MRNLRDAEASTTRLPAGLFWAALTCLLWSPLYLAPKRVAPYGTTDLVLLRLLLAFAIIAILKPRLLFRCGYKQIAAALILSFTSTTGYYTFLSIAINNTNASVSVCILGLISVSVLLVDNAISKAHEWKPVIFLAAIGAIGSLLFVQESVTHFKPNGNANVPLGIIAALVALVLWTTYKVINRRLVTSDFVFNNNDWSDLTSASALFTAPLILLFVWLFPETLRSTFKLLTLAPSMLAAPLIFWSITLALCASLFAFRSYNLAEKNLPDLWSSQIVTLLIPLSLLIDYFQGDLKFDVVNLLSVGLVLTSMIGCGYIEWRKRVTAQFHAHGLRRI